MKSFSTLSRALLVGILGMFCVAVNAFAETEIETKTIEYSHKGTKLQGYVAYPKGSTDHLPGVLLVHEWWGHNDYIQKRARDFAKLGYVAFAADMYGAGVQAADAAKATELSKPFYQDRGLMRGRAMAALEQLKKLPMVNGDRLAALGYCFGGTVALELARAGAPLRAVITFHGGLSTPHPEDSKDIKPSILILNGAEDPFVKPEERTAFMDEMRKAGADWQFVEFSGAVHAFSNPDVDAKGLDGAKYNKNADVRSFEMAKNFLAERLK